MWPFASSEDSSAPVGEIIQTSVDPTLLQNLKTEAPTVTEPKAPFSYNRLSLPAIQHGKIIVTLSSAVGFFQGMSRGSDIAILCYRAENAHLTPTSKAGWFLYNKSKNYHAIIGGVKGGVKRGAVYAGWSTLFVTLQSGLDAARGVAFASKKQREYGETKGGQADFLNTLSAAVATAGFYSWWHGLDRFAAGRMTRSTVRFALPYGLAQDGVAWAKGERMWYIDGILRLMGRATGDSVSKLEAKQA